MSGIKMVRTNEQFKFYFDGEKFQLLRAIV